MRASISMKSYSIILVCLSTLAVLMGCSGHKVTTAAQDQSLLKNEQANALSMSGESVKPSETTRVTEQTIASPLSVQAQNEGVEQTAPAKPGEQPTSQRIAVATLSSGGLGDVFFDFDRFTLGSEARTTLETNAQYLKGENDMKVWIEGHCDERGTLAYNLVLGERRAHAVRQYLQELGISPSQIEIVSYGKERPFCAEHREACWQQNRRGHFVVK